ncbi:MAG TPA: hypothetical protein VFG48_09220 [Xanthomonadales bacterium]|nr:hypothetical protein [Xanthomonadales bacterium]
MFAKAVPHTTIAFLLAMGVLVVNPALAQEITGTFAGSHFPVLSDYDGDGVPNPVTANQMTGVATVFGRFAGRSVGESRFEGEYCSETEVKLNWVADTAVYTAANGDVLYAVFVPEEPGDPDSHLCFNFLDSTFRATVHLKISGGTGRFADATGHLIVASTGVLATSGLGGFWQGTLSGRVSLPRK